MEGDRDRPCGRGMKMISITISIFTSSLAERERYSVFQRRLDRLV